MRWRDLAAGLKRLLQPRQAQHDLRDEIDHFVDEATAEYVRAGLSPEDAARAARVELGSAAAVQDQVRERRWEHALESFARDARDSARVLRRAPGFSVVAILVLTLGIGTTTAVFSLINAVLYRPLPVHRPSELAFVYPVAAGISAGELASYRSDEGALSGVASVSSGYQQLADDGIDRPTLFGEIVSAEYFDVLGVRPQLGRGFRAEQDDAGDAPLVVVISDRLWRREFGADPGILGQTIRLMPPGAVGSAEHYAVVGVMGPGFVGVTSPWEAAAFWTLEPQVYRVRRQQLVARAPATLSGFVASDRNIGTVVGRRHSGVSIAQVHALVNARHASFQTRSKVRYPPDADRSLVVLDSRRVRLPLDERGRIKPDRLAAALMAVAGLVLLIALTNLSGLTIARGIVRRSEIAVRLTLGATRRRLARQLLTEGLMLSVAGGVGGLVISRWIVTSFVVGLPSVLGATGQGATGDVMVVPLDARVFAFTAALVVMVAVVVGLAPVRQAGRVSLLTSLSGVAEASPTRVRRGLRYLITVPQIALSTVLLISAGMALRFLVQVVFVDPGYRPERLVMVNMTMPLPARTTSESATRERSEKQMLLWDRFLSTASSTPGVVAAALALGTPLSAQVGQVVVREGFSDNAPHYPVSVAQVSPTFFDTIGLQIQHGRAFVATDTVATPPVAMLDELTASQLWPGRSAIGQFVGMHTPNTLNAVQWLEVVGVAGSVRGPLSDGESRPFLYVPLAQNTTRYFGSFIALVARAGPEAGPLMGPLRRAMSEADADSHVATTRLFTEVIDAARYPRRMAALMLISSALAGLVLAAVGLYGVVSYSVAQRMKELGIRAALGADRSDLISLVVREAGVTAAIGALCGGAIALVSLRVVSNQVFAVPGLDAITLVSVPLILATVVIAACYAPARRAARADPMHVLRWQ